MRIPAFSLRNQRGIAFAGCETVPRLMIIAGPNGAGKSTLLNGLREQPGQGRIIYISPHRTSRKQQVQARHLLQQQISFEDLMAGQNMPGLEGIGLVTGLRDPWSFDDAVNYLKHGLCQIEIDRQQAITMRFDREGQLAAGAVPDVWHPLRELVSNLLPHLRFKGIDTSDKNQVRCLWEVHKKGIEVDLDDLSSGEKSIIQMFYPLVEHRIRSLLQTVGGTATAERLDDICVLIDEPELHLHNNLQAKVLDYLRVLASDEHLQVIVATHSSSMVEYANFDELYILRPVELVQADENQLIQVATDEERLRFLRDNFGSTANLTSFQPILIVEGGNQEERSRRTTDRKMYRALHPKFDRVTIMPGGGKGECVRLRGLLQEALSTFTDKLQVTVLLDRDLATEEHPDANVRMLNVSMIENLLLDPEVIWEAIQSVSEKTAFRSSRDVAVALDAILTEYDGPEVQRRTMGKLETKWFRPHGPIECIPEQVSKFVEDLQVSYAPERLEAQAVAAMEEVKEIQRLKKRRELYHGKDVLETFYKRHLHDTGLPKNVFRFYAARQARSRKSVTGFFDALFADLLPNDLDS